MQNAWKKYVAEMIGTGILTFMVLTSLGSSFSAFTPVIAGLTLGLFVYTIGGISGAHINPAVTAGLWSVKKINTPDAMNYIIFQFLGAVIASAIFKIGINLPLEMIASASPRVFFIEAAGAAVLLFGISSVVHGKTPGDASGIVIGGSLTLGVLMASSVSNGVLNPAVAIGIGSVSWAYVLGPLLGAVVSCMAYRWLAEKDSD